MRLTIVFSTDRNRSLGEVWDLRTWDVPDRTPAVAHGFCRLLTPRTVAHPNLAVRCASASMGLVPRR